LRFWNASTGRDSHEVAVALNNLAAVQLARGPAETAEALYRRALASDIA
jgi:Flp pilus assembly protein TadD